MDDVLTYVGKLSLLPRLAVFAGLAVITHLLVIFVRRIAAHFLLSQPTRRFQKLKSIATLTTSAIIFSLYFLAVGLILREFGVSLTAYLASASVLGLAIGFGSQGIVQDVVTGLTLIFSDLVDVGDLVEISGQSGIVKAITMRFLELENALGAAVFIPNRTISNITNYPRGYIHSIGDITLCGDEASKKSAENPAIRLMNSTFEKFPGIFITEPSSEGRKTFKSGKEILRIKFRIWPNRGQPIETSYCQELIAELKAKDAAYEPWMISICYEAEKKFRQLGMCWSWPRRKGQLSTPSTPTGSS